MRVVLAVVGWVLAVGGQGLAQPPAPIAPLPGTPDYTLTLRRHDLGVGPHEVPDRFILRRHGSWVRISSSVFAPHRINGGDSVHRRLEEIDNYYDVDRAVDMSVRRTEGRYLSASIDLRREQPEASRTSERDEVLGEACEVWQIGRQRRSCLTSDGIELWTRYGDRLEFRAIAFERRPVAEAEVRPPTDMLRFETWLDPAAQADPFTRSSGHQDDAEMSLLYRYGRPPAGDEQPVEMLLRRPPWHHTERHFSNGARSRYLRNDATCLNFGFQVDAEGRARRFSAWRADRGPGCDDFGHRMVDTGSPPETIAGEPCRWFAADATRTSPWAGRQCRTQDGVVLHQRILWQRGSEWETLVTRLVRRQVTVSEIQLPQAMLRPSLWGLGE